MQSPRRLKSWTSSSRSALARSLPAWRETASIFLLWRWIPAGHPSKVSFRPSARPLSWALRCTMPDYFVAVSPAHLLSIGNRNSLPTHANWHPLVKRKSHLPKSSVNDPKPKSRKAKACPPSICSVSSWRNERSCRCPRCGKTAGCSPICT